MNQSRSIPPEPPGLVRRFLALLPAPYLCIVLAAAAAGLLSAPTAYATVSVSDSTDCWALLISPSTGYTNSLGAMEVAAPTSSQDTTEEAMFSFNAASIASQLNAEFPHGWTVTSISVTLNSNNPTAGVQPNNSRFNVIDPGLFQLSWLSNNGWQSGVSYNTLSNYLPGSGNSNQEQLLGTYYYFADGTSTLAWFLNSSSGIVNEILSGGEISILATPGDTIAGQVGYLFNTNVKGDPPVLTVTAEATPVPIPAAIVLLAPGMAGLGFLRKRANKKGGLL